MIHTQVRNNIILLLFCSLALPCSSQTFTWMKGSTIINHVGFKGTQGVSSPAVTPQSRSRAHGWTDSNNNLWLFGGADNVQPVNLNNELYKYNISTNEWTWISGFSGGIFSYGTKNVASASNIPGSRLGGACWKTGNNEFYLYGGAGITSNYFTMLVADLGDLWKYSPATNMWTWVHGADTADAPPVYGTQGLFSPLNTPGARWDAQSWQDLNGNLWLFGGRISQNWGQFSDLWKYDLLLNEWTWINGSKLMHQPDQYGSLGVPSSTAMPGAREDAATWTDNNGDLWLFGGREVPGPFMVLKNDLWKYTISTNQWTWVNGDSIGSSSNNSGLSSAFHREPYCLQNIASDNSPTPRHGSVHWVNADGDLCLYGGLGFNNDKNAFAGILNDFWRYNINTNKWILEKGGPAFNQSGIYGTVGTPASTNIPTSRVNAVSWVDQANRLWLTAGYTSVQPTGLLNDLWLIENNCPQPFIEKSTPSCFLCQGDNYTLTATGATDYLWNTGQTSNTFVLTPQNYSLVTLSYTNTNQCKGHMTFSITYQNLPPVAITASTNHICLGTPVQLSVKGANSYTWNTSQTATAITVNPPVTTSYSVIGVDTNHCFNSAVKIVSVSPIPVVSASVTPSSICIGQSAVLSADGASTYTWNNMPASGQVVTVSPVSTSLYFVQGANNAGCKSAITNVTLTVVDCTGFDELSHVTPALLYPNPNSGEFLIDAPVGSEINILDHSGRLVSRLGYPETGRIETDLPAGCYFITVTQDKKLIRHTKMIIIR